MSQDDEILEVMRAEKSRGSRKPIDLLALKQLRDFRLVCRELLKSEASEEEAAEIMRALGVPEERLAAVLKVWRDEQRSSKLRP